jgi:hypothetical protein
MSVEDNELEFHKLLNMLAMDTGMAIDEFKIEFYDKELSIHGYDRVNIAIKEILRTRRSRDPFPSIADICEKLGFAANPKSIAVDTSNKIIWAFKRWGTNYSDAPNFQEAFIANFGPLAWDTVERLGGYRSAHSEWNESREQSFFRAHVRETALALMDLQKVKQENLRLEGGSKFLPLLTSVRIEKGEE